MQKFQFVTVDTILAKYSRDFRGLGINTDDAIEWIGEALGFIKIASASEEAIAFIEVKDYQAAIPCGLHYIIQIARKNNWSKEQEDCTKQSILASIVPEVAPQLTYEDSQGVLSGSKEIVYYRPYFDLQYEYLGWANSNYKKQAFSPVTLADSSFFNSLVCQTKETENLYIPKTDEYTIVQDQLRFNFKEGFVAVAHVRQMMDTVTGYPMVPDDESAKAAITYYLGWKTKERETWNHREGAGPLADRAEMRWLKYCKQFKNKAKMPQGADQYQNLMEQHQYLVPNKNKYYGFFGRVPNRL